MESAAAASSPAIGLAAPGFSALDQNRRRVSLSDYDGRYVVLYFYPKDDTPGCVCEATEFTDLLYTFHELGGDVVGVSPDSPESHKRFEKKYGLQVRLLADPEHAIMRKYGAWVDTRIGDARHGRVVRTTYILDPRGRIAWHWPEVIPEGHAARVSEKLAELREPARRETSRRSCGTPLGRAALSQGRSGALGAIPVAAGSSTTRPIEPSHPTGRREAVARRPELRELSCGAPSPGMGSARERRSARWRWGASPRPAR